MLFDAEGFGKRLRQHRVKNHLTQAALAELIDTETSSISHLENGTHSPSLNTLIKLCNVLEIGVDDLLADSLPNRDIFLDMDIAKQLENCTAHEKQVIRDVIAVLKKSMRTKSGE
ncbi:MAG: helix-turn-helix domain-containing protein [Lachnospiraceae bacterium]|nr:helix-turn-helix domain-containing protein [Lachnospiraceae bacterium]